MIETPARRASSRTIARRLRAEIAPLVRTVVAQQSSRIERRTVVAVQNAEGRYTGGTCDVRDGLGAVSFGIRWYESRPVIGDVVLVEFPPPGGTRRVLAICREVKTGNAALAPATLSGNAATAGTLGDSDRVVGPVVYVADFGGAGDANEDDTSPLQDAIDAVAANGGGTVVCVSGGVHLTTGVIRINASAVTLDLNGATIRRVNTPDGTTDPVIQIMPDPGNAPISQSAVQNGAVDGGGKASQSVLVRTVAGARLTALQLFGATEWQLLTGSEEAVGDCDQLNVSGLTVVATGSAGGVKLDGDGDTTCTRGAHFANVQISTDDGDAFYFGNADTNNVDLIRTTVAGSGRGIVFAASAVSADQAARHNHVYHADPGGRVYSLADDFPATGNKVELNSGSPAPIVDDGSDLAWISDHVGILGVDELPTLPDAAYPPGKSVVFLRVDDPPFDGGKLYRNVLDVWTAAVPAVDIEDLTSDLILPDGAPPASSPTPTVEAGIGSLVARWTPVSNHDLVTYEVHVSPTTGFTPGPTTLYGETVGASMVVRKTPAGAALAAATTYYVKIIAKDLDGSAAAGSQGSSQVATVATSDIAAGAVTGTELAAAAVSHAKLAIDAVQSDVIQAGAITAGKIASGVVTATELAAAAVTHAKLAVNAVQADVILAGTISATELGSAAVTHAKLAIDAVQADVIQAATITATQIANNAITTPLLNAGAVTTAKIAAGAVTATEIAANTITAAKIVAGAITATELATDSVTTAKILANAVTAAKVATDTLTANEIAANAITTSELASGSVTAAKIVAGTITATEIAAATITGAKIAAATITASNVATDTLTANEIAANAITTSELASGSVTAAKIVAGTITATEIAAATITGAKIAAGTITASNMVADTLTANEIAAGAISTSELAAGAVTAAKITAGTITSNEIAALTIVAANIAAATITGGKIAGTTITAANIAADTITAGEIAANAITTSELNANAVTAAKIAANTITASQIAAGTITTTEIASATIVAGNIATDTLTASQIGANAITTSELNALAVTSAKIAANTIVAGNIAAGTITSTEIAANTITTGKLAVTASVGYVDNSIGGSVTNGVVISPSGITITDVSGTAVLTGAGFGGPWLSYVESKLYNAVFDSGPTGGNGTTIATGGFAVSSVPNWTLSGVVGTHIVVTWRNDASVGRAGQVRFNLTAGGAANDAAYMRQDVPIPPAGSTVSGTHVATLVGSVTTLAAGMIIDLRAQYLKADGSTATGTEGTFPITPGSTGDFSTNLLVIPNSGVQPTDAAFLRVRFGFKRGTASTAATAQVEIYGVEVQRSPRFLPFGTGTHMGMLTTGTEGYGGEVYLAAYENSLQLLGSGLAMTSSLFRFDTAVTMTGLLTTSANIAATGTITNTGAMTITDGLATFRRDDNNTTSVNRYYSGASASGGVAAFTKSRAATIGATDAAVVAGDILYALQFQGIDSAAGSYQIAAGVYGMADTSGTIAAGRVDGSLSFRTAQAGTLTEQWVIKTGGNLVATDGNNLQFGTTTGSKIGTAASQKLSFWGVAAVAQAALNPTGLVAVTAAGATNTWFRNTSTTGGIAGNAYTVPDIVFALKTVGLLP